MDTINILWLVQDKHKKNLIKKNKTWFSTRLRKTISFINCASPGMSYLVIEVLRIFDIKMMWSINNKGFIDVKL
jgi:hypothetical protein